MKNGTMKAAVLRQKGGPDIFRIEDWPIPKPGFGQALVRVRACGVCNHEVVVRSPDLTHKSYHPPQVLGHEIAGEVVELGEGARELKVGDRVACTNKYSCRVCERCRRDDEIHCPNGDMNEGGYGEFAAINEESLVRMPEGMPFEHAAICGCAVGIALRGVRWAARVVVGETVLVTGPSGGIGAHSVQLARLAGARVIAATTSEEKVEALRQLGADEVVVTGGKPYHKQVMALTGGQGVDVVIDTVGSAVFESAFRSMGYHARYVLIGEFYGDTLPVSAAWMFRKETTLQGSGAAHRSELEDCLRLLHQGKIKPVIAKTYPIEDIVEVHRQMERKKHVGRLVITF